jgi:chorismate mutase
MQPIHPLIRLIVVSSFFISVTAQAQQCGQTAPLINARLGYMKDIAGYKAENHLPVEDRIQEEKVLNNAMTEAESLGLSGESIKPFMVAQINAAKAIQYRYRADWLSQPEKDWQPKPLDKVRPHIGVLSTQILEQIAKELKTCERAEMGNKEKFLNILRQHNLKDADVEALFSTFNQIKLK